MRLAQLLLSHRPPAWRAFSLLSTATLACAMPTADLNARILQTSSTSIRDLSSKASSFRRQDEHNLPPVSAVMMALAMHSMPQDNSAPTLVPNAMDDSTHFSSSTSLAMTLPYTGPGRLILSGSSFITLPTHTPAIKMGAENSSHSSQIRHLAVVGGAIAGIIILTVCLFFLMDPRIWKPCCAARRERRRTLRLQKARQKALPSWMRVKPDYTFPDNLSGERKSPNLSPYVSPRSKFSLTSSDCGYSGDSDALSTPSASPNLFYNERDPHPTLNVTTDDAVGISRPMLLDVQVDAQRPSIPARPPRPPTVDSPAAIESMYYADVDDQDFYRHPNPLVLDRGNKLSSTTKSHFKCLPTSHQSFTSSKANTDALQQQHSRSRSVPTDSHFMSGKLPSISNRNNLRETPKSTRPHRKSKSAASWIWYAEFQQRHHPQLQQKNTSTSHPISNARLLMDRRDSMGTAY